MNNTEELKKDNNSLPKKDGFRRAIIIGAIIIISILFLFGFLPRFFHTKKISKIAAENPLPKVATMIAKPQDKPVNFVLPSSTSAHHVTPIWSRGNGYIIKLLVDIGDVVKEGEVLAELDTTDVDQEYYQALNQVESLVATRDDAKIAAERWQELQRQNPDAIAKQDVDDRVATYMEAEANLLAAVANMNHYKELMSYKYIVAPFDGIITERNIDLGSLITAGSAGTPQQLFVISKIDYLRIFVNVPQYYSRLIYEGLEAVVTIREFPDRNFTAVVRRYAKALDPVARTLLTELHISNPKNEIYTGLYSEVHFIFTPEQPYYIVPTPAVIIREGLPKIAVVGDDGIVHMKTVKIGLDEGSTMQIIDGLEPNDRIVTAPNDRVKEGAKVDYSQN